MILKPDRLSVSYFLVKGSFSFEEKKMQICIMKATSYYFTTLETTPRTSGAKD